MRKVTKERWERGDLWEVRMVTKKGMRGDLWQSSSSCFQARLGVSLSQSSSTEWINQRQNWPNYYFKCKFIKLFEASPIRNCPFTFCSTLTSVHGDNWKDDVSQVDDNHNDNINVDNVVKADEENKEGVKHEKSSVEKEKCDQRFWQSCATSHLGRYIYVYNGYTETCE